MTMMTVDNGECIHRGSLYCWFHLLHKFAIFHNEKYFIFDYKILSKASAFC